MKQHCSKCGKFDMEHNGHQDELKVTTETAFAGVHWVFYNKKGESISVICHDGSYGRQDGLFEIMTSWHDDVIGHLTFGQVQRWLSRLKRRCK